MYVLKYAESAILLQQNAHEHQFAGVSKNRICTVIWSVCNCVCDQWIEVIGFSMREKILYLHSIKIVTTHKMYKDEKIIKYTRYNIFIIEILYME